MSTSRSARVFIVAILSLAFAGVLVGPALSRSSGSLPTQGILAPGVSLGGLHVGDSMAQVVKRWGHNYRVCPKNQCKGTDTVWFYIYGSGDPLGASVRFNKAGFVTAVFTLGSPAGWRTSDGLLVGQAIDEVTKLYGNLNWSVCVGFGAMSMRNAKVVTSIYTTGQAVYGFAITAPGTPVCQ